MVFGNIPNNEQMDNWGVYYFKIVILWIAQYYRKHTDLGIIVYDRKDIESQKAILRSN